MENLIDDKTKVIFFESLINPRVYYENSYSFQQNKESLIIYSRNDEQLVFFIDQ